MDSNQNPFQDIDDLITVMKEGEIMKRQLALQQVVPLLERLIDFIQNQQNTNQENLSKLQTSITQMLDSQHWYEVSFALKITQSMIDKFDQTYTTHFFQKVDELLLHQENRVQELVVEVIQTLQPKYTDQIGQLYQKILSNLDKTFQKTTAEEQNHYIPLETMVQTLLKGDYANKIHRLKVVEAMFQCKYQFTNPQNVLVQGQLGMIEGLYKYYGSSELLSKAKQIFIDHLIESRYQILLYQQRQQEYTVLQKSINHQNKYVRKFSIDLLKQSQSIQDQSQINLYFNLLQQGLNDESIEVRKSVLLYFQQILQLPQFPYEIKQFKDFFCIGLLLNCHMENLMEISASISQILYKEDAEDKESQNPILGLVTYITKNQLQNCLQLIYQGTVSRYYQIRACSGLTLQSIVLFLKNTNELSKNEISKILLNLAYYEPDPQARAAGLSALHHFLRLYDLDEQQIQCIGDCASFHLSDIPYNCKENCAKLIAIIYQKTKNKQLIEEKCEILKDRKLILEDYLGPQVQDKEYQDQVQKQLNSQGGKERVVTKHQLNITLGVALIMKHFGVIFGQELNELKPYLVYLMSSCVQILRQNYLFNEGFSEYKQLLYVTINESLVGFKQVKRLPIKVLEEAEYFYVLKNDLNQGNLVNSQQIYSDLGKIIGENILKGRLESV